MKYKSEPWIESAACRQVGVEPFFPEIGEDWHGARKVCTTSCKVRLQCLDLIMRIETGTAVQMRAGIWAGLTPAQRKRFEPEWLAGQEVAA